MPTVAVDIYVREDLAMSTHIDVAGFPRGGDTKMMFIAAAPYDRRYSTHGSCLPFPNYALAFEGTPNKGVAMRTVRFSDDNDDDKDDKPAYAVKLCGMPNTFYASGGRSIVPPTVYVRFGEREYSIKMSCGLRNKVLNYPRRRTAMGPSFYDNVDDLPVRSQEEILLDGSAGTDRAPSEFWGGRPAR